MTSELSAVEPSVTAEREQSWASASPIDDAARMFQPGRQRINLDGPRRADVWLVSRDGQGLFVSECQPFIKWFLGENPDATIEDVTSDVPAALARTAR